MTHVVPASAPDVIAVTNGMAEVFERHQIVGWVEAEKGAPSVRVGLYVNEVMAVETWAVDSAQRLGMGEVRTFRLHLDDFWRFVKTTDQISVRAGGRAIPITGKGMYLHPETTGRTRRSSCKRCSPTATSSGRAASYNSPRPSTGHGKRP